MKKYAVAGCGSRGITSYILPLVRDYGDAAMLCGLYDLNPLRSELARKLAEKDIPVYTDFDTMLREAKPDTVIVTTKDCTHSQYVIRAMEAGCDVICEKPLTTDFKQANAIREAMSCGKNLTVTFNLRFHPFFRRIKELLQTKVLGDILSVHYEWMLDTRHGADYFRRWHRERKNSGSLLVHKSTHHFDLVNWFLEQDPVAVNAFGTRRFYGPVQEERSERCLTCPHKTTCPYVLDITADAYRELYLNCESADGYFRDRCIFSEEIDIEDSVSLNVRYSGGTVMSYSLTAHSPYEGLHLVLSGTKGRMEAEMRMTELPGYSQKSEETITIVSHTGEVTHITVPKNAGSEHGGADGALRNFLFRGEIADPQLGQAADLRAGLMSIGIGMAANVSMKEGRQVALEEFYGKI